MMLSRSRMITVCAIMTAVGLILGIAKNLNIPVVAEGVETEAQMKILKDLGCTLVQGYYFSRPLHPSEFEANILQNL